MYLFPTRSNLCKDYTLFLFLWIPSKNIPSCKQYFGFEDMLHYFSRTIRTNPLKQSISLDSDYKFLVEEFTENSFEEVQPEVLKR